MATNGQLTLSLDVIARTRPPYDGSVVTIIRENDNSWDRYSFSNSDVDMHRVQWIGNGWIGMGNRGTVYTSANGYGFSYASRSQPEQPLHAAAYSDHVKVIVGAAGTVLTSRDGYSWVQVNTHVSEDLYEILWTGTSFIALGDGVVALSDDASNWRKVTLNTNAKIRHAVVSDERVVAFGDKHEIYVSH